MGLFGRPSERDEERAQYYRQWLLRRNPFAIASIVFGVVSIIEFGVLLVFGVAGIVCGVVALVQLARVRGRPPSAEEPEDLPATEGHGLAWTGIVLSGLSLMIAVFVYTWPVGA